MLAIYLREIKDLAGGLRFLIAACLFLAGMAVNGFVSGGAYRDLSNMHARIESQGEQRLSEASARVEQLATSFNEIFDGSERAHTLILSAPPPRMLPLAAGAGLSGLEGVEWNFPNIVEPADLTASNTELPSRPALDWEFMVRILLSFVAVILSYDSIAGERERGTLALVLTYPVSRRGLLTAKFLAVMTLLAALLLAGGALSTLIYLSSGGGALGAVEYARVGLFVVGALLYVALFVAVSLLVSARARSAVSSLTILLIFWISATVVVPQGGTAAVQGLVRTVSDVQVEQELIHKLEDQVNEMIVQMDAFVRPDVGEARKDGFSSEQRYARAVNQMIATIKANLDEQQASHRRQAGVLQNVLRLTPSGLFQLGSERLLGVGEARGQHFLRSVDRWADEYEDFVRARDALDSDSPHIFYVQNYMSQKPVDAGAIPRFRFEELSLTEGLKGAAQDFALLGLELAAALALAFAAFNRAPVR